MIQKYVEKASREDVKAEEEIGDYVFYNTNNTIWKAVKIPTNEQYQDVLASSETAKDFILRMIIIWNSS